jgi:hypothetical protein
MIAFEFIPFDGDVRDRRVADPAMLSIMKVVARVARLSGLCRRVLQRHIGMMRRLQMTCWPVI